jgi:glycosyltransferase involved in cell wall biosynthesis
VRVLLVSDFFPPVRGGLETHVDDLAAELADRGHDVHVATLTSAPTPAHPDVSTHVVRTASAALIRHEDGSRPFHPPVPDPRARVALGRIIRELRPDVVHAHSWLGVSLPRHRRPPTVFTAHDYALVCQLHTLVRTSGEACAGPSLPTCVACGSRRYGSLRSLALASSTPVGRHLLPADRVLTLSRQVASVLRPHLSIPVEVVGGFVRTHRTAVPIPAGATSPPTQPFVMYAGDPGAHKGLGRLLDMWAGERPPAAALVVATTKPLDRPAPPGVTVVTLARGEVGAWWRAAAVAVVPSIWAEPYGMVAIEALTAGVPVIAHAVGALPELVTDGVDGLLVAPDDPLALRAALDRLIADENVRRRMGAAALESAHRFAADAVVRRIEAAYLRAIASAQAAA